METVSDGGMVLGKAGLLLFTIGLLIGFALAKLRTPRLGLSAHLTAVQTGTTLIALALFWPYTGVPPSLEAVTIHAIVGSSYSLAGGILLSAVWGASDAQPIAGKGFSASKVRENIVTIIIYLSASIMALAYLVVCWFALF
ncbi:MAG: hypothetical protein AAGL10_01100 [Pseudomonadota bacterium]